jgi:superfamily II DNA or RNA helicase
MLRDKECRGHLLALLPRGAAVELLQHLGVDSTAAPYGALLSLAVRKNSARELRLFEYFGIVPDPEPASKSDAGLSEAVGSTYPLFEHQRTAARRVSSLLDVEPRRVLLHMPTGAGKTRTTMHVICDHLRRREPTLVLWLAYSEELCDQAAEEFERAWTALGDREVPLTRYWGQHDLTDGIPNDGLLVAGLSKTYSAARRSIDFIARLADRTSLVVIDEAHQAVAETYRLILDVVFSKGTTSLLGLTATPGRTWSDIAADEKLSRFFARCKVGLQVEGYANPVDYLIQEGYLAKPHFVPLNYSGSQALSDRDIADISRNLDIPERIVMRLAEDEIRNLRIVEAVERLVPRHRRTLVFAATVEHANLLATVLQARGIDADSVTGESSSSDRERCIRKFKDASEEPRVLCNYGVLTTGFDAPATSAAVIARPTKSLVLYFQMVGRAIRGPRAGGNDDAEILTVVDLGLPGFGDVGEAFLNWEDVWT